MARDGDSKANRLARELVDVRSDVGLNDPGRLIKCSLLMEAAARICHPKGEKGEEPLLDAMRVLTDAVQELPEEDRHIINTAFAIGKGNWPRKLMTRRSDLAADFDRDPRTISRWEERILKAVSLKIVAREQQAILAEAESQTQEQQTASPAPDISVENIEATLALNDDCRPIGRESSITVRPLCSVESSITAVLELNDGEFGIDNTVNCSVVNPQGYFAVAEPDFQQGSDMLETALATLPDEEDESIRRVKIHAQELAKSLSNIQACQQELRQLLERLSANNARLGVSDTLEIKLPSLRAGEPLTFSYETSYPHPIDKIINFSLLSFGGSTGCVQSYLTTNDTRAFVLTTELPLPLARVRIRANQPLKVVPWGPGTAQFLSQLRSMPFMPLGSMNFISAKSDGSYEHTFRNLPSDTQVALVWFVEPVP